MLTLLKLALRDLRHQPAFAIFFVVNLALGLAGAMTLDGLQGSIERMLAGRSRSFLGADVRVSSSRPLMAEERARIDAVAEAVVAGDAGTRDGGVTAELVQMYSMVWAPGASRLAEVRAIDGSFPPQGSIVLAGAGEVDDARRAELAGERGAWADPALLAQLGVELGDSVRVGGVAFYIKDTIVRDTGLSVRAASLAPRLYVSREHLAATGLVQLGSRVEYQWLFSFAPGADARRIAAAMRAAVDAPRIRIASHDEATEEISGGYERVTRYLGLVSLVALAMAGVACAYLFRSFLHQRLVDLAILMSLGARRSRAHALLLIELGLLGLLAAVAATAIAATALPLLGALLSDVLPARIDLALAPREMIPTLVVALAVGPLCCLPLLARLGSLRVAELFQEHARLSLQKGRREILWYVPALLLLLAVAVARTGEVRQATTFVALVVVAFAATALLGRILLEGVSRARPVRSVPVRLALRQLAPRRQASLTAFVAVALCALLLSLPPQLRSLLDERLRPPAAEDIPSLFLFDIQPEQAGPLRDHVARAGTELQRLAPMVRARLDAINGESIGVSADPRPVARVTALRDRQHLRGRRYNLTYQAELAATETLVEGRPFSGAYDLAGGALAEISMEIDFAKRLGVGLGDELRFDVQGVPVEGRIVNLRSVDWNSMQPNFFVSFQPGVLESAPAVFLASVPALPPAVRDRLQASVVEAFPNVSMIDVSRGVDRLLGLLDQLQWAITATAVTSLAVGLLLVFAIARDEAQVRRWDVNMLKVLGARHGLVRRSIDVEFAVLGLGAGLVGCAAGAAVCAVLAMGPLDVAWSPPWKALVLVIASLPIISTLAARVAMRGVLAERPLALLR